MAACACAGGRRPEGWRPAQAEVLPCRYGLWALHYYYGQFSRSKNYNPALTLENRRGVEREDVCLQTQSTLHAASYQYRCGLLLHICVDSTNWPCAMFDN
jgi:hypothetical protein